MSPITPKIDVDLFQEFHYNKDMSLESITVPKLAEVLQSEYDRHMEKYFKGCTGCINSAIAITDLARILHINLVENDRTKKLRTPAS